MGPVWVRLIAFWVDEVYCKFLINNIKINIAVNPANHFACLDGNIDAYILTGPGRNCFNLIRKLVNVYKDCGYGAGMLDDNPIIIKRLTLPVSPERTHVLDVGNDAVCRCVNIDVCLCVEEVLVVLVVDGSNMLSCQPAHRYDIRYLVKIYWGIRKP